MYDLPSRPERPDYHPHSSPPASAEGLSSDPVPMTAPPPEAAWEGYEDGGLEDVPSTPPVQPVPPTEEPPLSAARDWTADEALPPDAPSPGATRAGRREAPLPRELDDLVEALAERLHPEYIPLDQPEHARREAVMQTAEWVGPLLGMFDCPPTAEDTIGTALDRADEQPEFGAEILDVARQGWLVSSNVTTWPPAIDPLELGTPEDDPLATDWCSAVVLAPDGAMYAADTHFVGDADRATWTVTRDTGAYYVNQEDMIVNDDTLRLHPEVAGMPVYERLTSRMIADGLNALLHRVEGTLHPDYQAAWREALRSSFPHVYED